MTDRSDCSGVASTGPCLGPLIAGWLYVGTDNWRWTYWLLFILTGISFGIAMVVPETWRPVLLSRALKELDGADNQQKPDLGPILKTALIRPFQMMCTEPLLIAMSIYLCFIYMLLYLLFFAFPIAFVEVRGFSVGMVGTTFVSIIVSRGAGSWDLCLTSPSTDRSICPYNKIGILIAGCLLRYQEILYAREMAKRARPEARLFPMMLGCMQVVPRNPKSLRSSLSADLSLRFAFGPVCNPWPSSSLPLRAETPTSTGSDHAYRG